MKAALPPLPLRLVTHNIRYATASPFKGEELWSVRRPHLVSELKFITRYNAEAIICLQEVLDSQLQDILHDLKDDEWDFIGVGRDDGVKKGEYSPILYRKTAWEVLQWKSIWLSETPDKPGKGWDAASIRILTTGTFSHKPSKRTAIIMNTHLDDQGKVARFQSAKLIIRTIEEYIEYSKSGGNGPCSVLLAGDFNSTIKDDAYQLLSGAKSPVADLHDFVKGDNKYGHEKTYTSFAGEETPKRIDFLFIGPRSGGEVTEIRVDGYAVLENRFEDGVAMSDHRAVVGDITLV